MENEENPIYPIDLSIFKDQIRQSLLNILDSLPGGEKTLVLEKSCISKLNYLTSLDLLKERRVKKQLIVLKSTTFVSDSPIIIYLITPKIENLKIIEKHIESNTKDFGETQFNYHLIFIPKITGECYSFINDSKYKPFFNLHILNIDIYQLDYDLLSLENKNAFRDIYIERNLNCLSELLRATIKYETVFGKIKYKYSKGFYAKKLIELLNKEEENSNNNINKENETLACFIFDRSVDFVTPFCTNYVYEGILDDYFQINFNALTVSSKIFEKESKNENIKIDLSQKDKYYSTFKDLNIIKVRTLLPERLAEIKNKNLEKERKSEISSLTNHLNLVDNIKEQQNLPILKYYKNLERCLLKGELPNKFHDFIDDELSKKSDMYNILKMLCLERIIHSGVKSKNYDQIKKDFLSTYGYDKIFLWHNLEKAEILKPQDNNNNFFVDANKKLKLFFEDVDLNEPNDISYVYNGYAPLTIRLIEKALSEGGWNSIKDILKKTPGESNYPLDETEIHSTGLDKKFILLIFIGGITYGELAAIRYLNKKIQNKKFIVLTTGMINSQTIFQTLKNGDY